VSTPRRFVFVTAALISVSGALIGASIAALQMRGDARGWSKRAIAAEVELADKRAALESATTQLAELETRSEELQNRVDELADNKAQHGDDLAMVEMQRDAYERIATGYADVTLKWQACVKGHEQYERVLADRSKYDAADVRRFLKDLEELCTEAQDADAKLRSQLSR
jgi:TolA-binding protein